jgi:hypothetical protein
MAIVVGGRVVDSSELMLLRQGEPVIPKSVYKSLFSKTIQINIKNQPSNEQIVRIVKEIINNLGDNL